MPLLHFLRLSAGKLFENAGRAVLLAIFTVSFSLVAFSQNMTSKPANHNWEDEVFYQIFPRSFYDSNGDSVGDINGIREKLDYLQELGVTAVWTTPILKARCYHNYFVDSYDSLDPAFGTWADWTALVKEMHKRGMKIFLDMEPQYVSELHPWYKDSHLNPASKFTPYLWYTDSLNDKATTRGLGTYNKESVTIIGIRMNNHDVRAAITDLFRKFADPNGDVKFDDGVDGFRIDHMMDDLDHRGKNVNLYADFWGPLFAEIRQLNPDIFFLAEQSDWGFGGEAMTKGKVDGVFAFPQWYGTTTFDKKRLLGMIDSTWMFTPAGKEQFTFIENHDIDRYASKVGNVPGKIRVGAALNIFLKGVPCLYYGQEIGMTGTKGKWGSDGNDIPLRQAMRWNASGSGNGMALWYANSGPWWDPSANHPNDGSSVEEQMKSDTSLWNYYKKLIALRKSSPALSHGNYVALDNDNEQVVSFARSGIPSDRDAFTAVVVMNLSDQPQQVKVSLGAFSLKNPTKDAISGDKIPGSSAAEKGAVSAFMRPYAVLLIN
jgi:glycosidase